MSRAYRIKVRESLKKVVTAKDGVSTQLELLEVLPCDQMAELLTRELEKGGFAREGEALVRTRDGVTVTVDPANGTVTVQAEGARAVDLQTEKEGRAYDDAGPGAKQARRLLQEQARQELEKQAERETTKLQEKVTDRLQGVLTDLRQELDQAVNRATAEALKVKAAQLGQIKEMTEDPQTGSLTIVLEV